MRCWIFMTGDLWHHINSAIFLAEIERWNDAYRTNYMEITITSSVVTSLPNMWINILTALSFLPDIKLSWPVFSLVSSSFIMNRKQRRKKKVISYRVILHNISIFLEIPWYCYMHSHLNFPVNGHKYLIKTHFSFHIL